ncbi:MAG TPA: DinB family protein [Gemmatimonadaceae bacterium]|nr:DinB family protein [Gemmatimonadaceae bacterium]
MEGIDRVLMPAAHALVQAREDITAAAAGLTSEELWVHPGGAASLGFHLRHVAGSIDRLLAYARGQQLNDAQRAALAAESGDDPSATAEMLVAQACSAIDRALVALRSTDPATLHDARAIGRAGLPSSTFGVLCHIAEHTQRHTGQIITTSTVVRGLGAARVGGR